MPATAPDAPQTLSAWVLQDWEVNATRLESQLLLAWFRLAQWAYRHWGPLNRVVVTPYWWISSMILSVELPHTATVGPRLRLYHPHGIVLNPQCTLGADCHLRHAVTVGNTNDRAGNELGIATVGDNVELGAGCVVVGPIHVGDHARIGANAVVTKDVPEWAVVGGIPARVIRIDEPTA